MQVTYSVLVQIGDSDIHYDRHDCTYDGDDFIEAARAVLNTNKDVILYAAIWENGKWLCSGAIYERIAGNTTYKGSIRELVKVFEGMNKGYKIR